MNEYTWTAPSGVEVASCKPYRADEWTRFGSGWYAARSYWNWALVISGYADWAKKRKKAAKAKQGWNCPKDGHRLGPLAICSKCGWFKESEA